MLLIAMGLPLALYSPLQCFARPCWEHWMVLFRSKGAPDADHTCDPGLSIFRVMAWLISLIGSTYLLT